MRKFFAFLLSLIFVLFCYADFKFEITQEYKKGEGEISITGKTLEEVSIAVARTLVRLRCKILEKDEDIGLIIAERKSTMEVYDDEGEIVSTKKYVKDRWEILIESVEEKIFLVCSYEGEGAGFWGSDKKSFKLFSEKLKGILKR